MQAAAHELYVAIKWIHCRVLAHHLAVIAGYILFLKLIKSIRLT